MKPLLARFATTLIVVIEARREHQCEANYYAGVIALLDGRTADAREKFTACVGSGLSDFVEFDLSSAELARLAKTN